MEQAQPTAPSDSTQITNPKTGTGRHKVTISRNPSRNRTGSRVNLGHRARTEEEFRTKFLTALKQKSNITATEFLLSLTEVESGDFMTIATEKLINIWRANYIDRPEKQERFRTARRRLEERIQPYFSLYGTSPIGNKKWGELTGQEWGTIGAKGMVACKLLGPTKTAFELVGTDPKTCSDEFAKLISKIS